MTDIEATTDKLQTFEKEAHETKLKLYNQEKDFQL